MTPRKSLTGKHSWTSDVVPVVHTLPILATDVPGLPANTSAMACNVMMSVRPQHAPALNQEAIKDDGFHQIISHTAELDLEPRIMEAFAAAKECVAVTEDSARPPRPGDDVVIVPLGTSSAAPTTYRNGKSISNAPLIFLDAYTDLSCHAVSSTLIEIPKCGNILLDSGEGTWGQLARLFGDDLPARETGVWQVLRDLKCIFISHVHGDHHIGLAKILAMRRKVRRSSVDRSRAAESGTESLSCIPHQPSHYMWWESAPCFCIFENFPTLRIWAWTARMATGSSPFLPTHSTGENRAHTMPGTSRTRGWTLKGSFRVNPPLSSVFDT